VGTASCAAEYILCNSSYLYSQTLAISPQDVALSVTVAIFFAALAGIAARKWCELMLLDVWNPSAESENPNRRSVSDCIDL
jgi:hypothetical protein